MHANEKFLRIPCPSDTNLTERKKVFNKKNYSAARLSNMERWKKGKTHFHHCAFYGLPQQTSLTHQCTRNGENKSK